MNDNEIASLEANLEKTLRAGMPPERDPWFRIAVLERRERHLWRRRLGAAVCKVAVVSFLASLALATLVNASRDLIDSWLIEDSATILVALTIIAMACLVLIAALLSRKNRVPEFFYAWIVKLWV